jgi:hypothetical protein
MDIFLYEDISWMVTEESILQGYDFYYIQITKS